MLGSQFLRDCCGGHISGVVVLKRNFGFYPTVTESHVIFKLD